MAKSAEEWIAAVKADLSLPSDQASLKPEARIEGQRSDRLILEAQKPVGPKSGIGLAAAIANPISAAWSGRVMLLLRPHEM